MIGYLSGPITGRKDYRRQFAKAAAALKEMGSCPLLTTWCSFPAGSDPSAPVASWAALGTDKIIVSLEQLLTKEVTLS